MRIVEALSDPSAEQPRSAHHGHGTALRLAAVLMFVLLPAPAIAESTESAAGDARGYFGAPVVKYTTLRGQGAVIFGGRGGWNVTPSLTLGGGLYGTMTEVDARTGAVANAPGPLDVKLESFGVELEYAARPAAPTHLTVHALLGGAAAHNMRDKTNEQHGETDFMLLLEPAVGVEQRIVEWLHLNLAASFRLVNGVEQAGLKTGDVQGASATLAVKIGRF